MGALCVCRRYDGRGHLYDLTKHDADLVRGQPVQLSEEEQAVEAACDEERYLELVSNVQEKAMYEGRFTVITKTALMIIMMLKRRFLCWLVS